MTVKDMDGGSCAQLPPFSFSSGDHLPGGRRLSFRGARLRAAQGRKAGDGARLNGLSNVCASRLSGLALNSHFGRRFVGAENPIPKRHHEAEVCTRAPVMLKMRLADSEEAYQASRDLRVVIEAFTAKEDLVHVVQAKQQPTGGAADSSTHDDGRQCQG